MRALELLAPAKDLHTGMAAIDCGADAVYIGASRFGARATAGNSPEDIAQLCRYAHNYRARVYVTVNTLLHDDELPKAAETIKQLYDIGADAVLIQDFRLLQQPLPPIEIHASTQCDTRTIDDVMRIYQCGIRRVVLARELSLQQIKSICEAVPADMEIEVFVHGALCVSYSGRCYASEYCFNRSANRGECAQFCRLRFSLTDSMGHAIGPDAHYLSLKDMCRLDALESLVTAGVCSFKIEGRLKDEAYVRNVVAAYSDRLNEVVCNHPEDYTRQSLGERTGSFTPNVERTFNRGFSDYFLHGQRTSDMWSPLTPKAVGQNIGTLKQIGNNWMTVQSHNKIVNGDGLCFFDKDNVLRGFRVNKVEGMKLFPYLWPQHITEGCKLYRNQDAAFERQVLKANDKRRIPITLSIAPTDDGYRLSGTVMSITDKTIQAHIDCTFPHQQAQKSQHDNIVRQLSKWGDTLFVCQKVNMHDNMATHFIPSSILSDMRRQLTTALSEQLYASESSSPASLYHLNTKDDRQRQSIAEAIPQMPVNYSQAATDTPLMQCRFCLRHALGACKKHTTPTEHQLIHTTITSDSQPLYLTLPDGKQFRLEFDCKHCQMNLYAHK